ncbi:MAG: nuclear transport factor 2 family protein [Gammaproteobacteria bacterium]|nr:nuclear transport factor 2 family protein [Gammaproteobacteria bacterium]
MKRKLIGVVCLTIVMFGCSSETDQAGTAQMQDLSWVSALFEAVDSGDADAFVGFMSDDVVFRLRNLDPLYGKEAVHKDISELLAGIQGISHELSRVIAHDDLVIVQGVVTYTRLDGSTLPCQFVDVWTMRGALIQEYLIYIDNTEL